MLKFGDVIRMNEIYYIYLGSKKDDDILYFAKIISDKNLVSNLVFRKNNYKSNHVNKSKENSLRYATCFVILTTEDFKGQLGFLSKADEHKITISNGLFVKGLEIDDLKELQKEIINDPEVIPKALIDEVKKIILN